MNPGYYFLAGAVIAEVIGTSALKSSDGFSRLLPSLIVAVGYAISFYLLSLVLKTIPVGIAYAIWAGSGIVLISLAGVLLYGQIPDGPAILGMTMICVGVLTIYLFSNSVSR